MTIPEKVALLVQLGNRFGLLISNRDKEKLIIEFMKTIEVNIEREEVELQNRVRNRCLSLLKKFVNDHHNTINKEFATWLTAIKNFLRENPDSIFTRADKGHVTVALNR